MTTVRGLRQFAVRFDAGVLTDCVAIFVVLAAMLAANIEWVLTRVDWVDTWMYFGFFRHYDVSDYLAGNKKIARLPWILVGFVINKLFSPLTAALVLHVGCFALGAYYLYRLLHDMFGRPAAVIATLAYLTWVPNHGPGGWDYHNTLTPVLFFASYRTLMWAMSAEQKRFQRFFIFGVFYALTLHTNLLVILLIPALCLRAVHVRWTVAQRTAKWLGDAATGTVAGAAAITAFLGLINVTSGREFLFWDILVTRSAFLVEHPVLEKGWWYPWTDPWWTSNIDTPMLNAVLLLIVLYALFHWRRWSLSALLRSSSACAMLEYVACFALYALGQSLGHPLLEPFYMTMPLYLPLFIALAALISETGGQVRNAGLLVAFAAAAFGVQFVGRLSISPDLFLLWKPGTWISDLPPIFVTLVGFAVAALLRKIKPALAYCCLAVALGQTNTLWPIAADDRAPYDFRTASCKVNEALVSAVAGADDVMYPVLKRGHQIALWYRGDEFDSLSPSCRLATYQLGRPLYAMGYGAANVHYWDPEGSKEIPDVMLDQIVRRENFLVLITNDRSYVSRTLTRVQQRNPLWRESATYSVGDHGLTFGVHIISSPTTT